MELLNNKTINKMNIEKNIYIQTLYMCYFLYLSLDKSIKHLLNEASADNSNLSYVCLEWYVYLNIYLQAL